MDNAYAASVAYQLGLSPEFVRQMSAMPSITNEQILAAGQTASQNGDFTSGGGIGGGQVSGSDSWWSKAWTNVFGDGTFKGNAPVTDPFGNTVQPGQTIGQAMSGKTTGSNFVAKYGSNALAIAIGFVFIAAGLYGMMKG